MVCESYDNNVADIGAAQKFCAGKTCTSADQEQCCLPCPDWAGCMSFCQAASGRSDEWTPEATFSGNQARSCLTAAFAAKAAQESSSTVSSSVIKNVKCESCVDAATGVRKQSSACNVASSSGIYPTHDCSVSKYCIPVGNVVTAEQKVEQRIACINI